MAGATQRPDWVNDEKHVSTKEKLIEKSKNDPYIPIGVAGTVAVLGYGIYAYRFRGPMSTSRYLMRLRVLAQSAIVGAIVLGVAFSSSSTKSK
ncbi:hypothetical protein EMCRGX_G019344 [Ephydatia muelleri]|eukprot:Em0011g681a